MLNRMLFRGYKNLYRNLSNHRRNFILGIETSCDDTGCAVLDTCGNVLGEALHSQQSVHLNNGGIIPPIAQSLHREHIEDIVHEAVHSAGISFTDIDAIATTVKPGLPLSLLIGMKYGKHLCRLHDKPFIPIHHMEAHALTARMVDSTVHYPFLVLLISGGHCLLAIVNGVDQFLLLGQSLDDAPGEAFDKTARRLKLGNIPELANMSGGQAIERAAALARDPLQFPFTTPLLQYKDCNFSMAGLKHNALRHILRQEKLHTVIADGVIPDVYNLCAGFQLAITRHLCHRTQRAMEYINLNNLIPAEKRTLVVSGGAACNNFITRGLERVCDAMAYRLVRPPPKLCTDNGVMIAWNGVERWRAGRGIVPVTDLHTVDIEARAPLGQDLTAEVTRASIKCDWVKLTSLLQSTVPREHVM
ncbi:Threonyl-carbamoyl synthesis 4 [Carabus blaptoides fortunei]